RQVHRRILGRRLGRDANRLQPGARRLEIARAWPARVRPDGGDARRLPACAPRKPFREGHGLRSLLRDPEPPPLPLAHGRRRHLRVRAEEAVSVAARTLPRSEDAFLMVATLAAGLYIDVLTDIAGQTALGLAVWLVLFYVLRGTTGVERRALMACLVI